MATQITLTLPDEMVSRLQSIAQLTGYDLDDLVERAITASLPAVDAPMTDTRPANELSDEEVLQLTGLEMQPEQDMRLSALLDRQQAGILSGDERAELHVLLQHYELGLLRKAQGLREAVRRGLHEPLGQ
jgi:hypothetical protein